MANNSASAYILQDPDGSLWLVSNQYMDSLPFGAQPVVFSTVMGVIPPDMIAFLDGDVSLPESLTYA